MKFVLKKDLKFLLPSFAMFVMASIAMTLFTSYGLITKNGDFTVTALYIFYFLIIGVTGITMLKGANLYRKQLSDKEYLRKMQDEGITESKFIIYKMFWTFVSAEILYILYTILFGIMKVIADKVLDDVSVTLSDKKFVPKADLLISGFSGVAIVLGLTALVFTTFGLCYRYFLRGRYALIGSAMTTFTGFWVVWKIYDTLIPVNGILSLLGTVIYALILTALCVFILTRFCSKDIYKFD